MVWGVHLKKLLWFTEKGHGRHSGNNAICPVKGVRFGFVRGLHRSLSSPETLVSCSSMTGLPWQLEHVVLQRGGGGEPMREGIAREMRRKEKEKREEERERDTWANLCEGRRENRVL